MPSAKLSWKDKAGARERASGQLACLAIGLILGGCASVSGKSDWDREASFTDLRTFVWLEAPRDSADADDAGDPFLGRRLRRSVESVLRERGFAEGSGEAPVDFAVTAYAIGPSTSDAARQSYRGPGPRISFGFGVGFAPTWGYGGWYPYCCGVGRPYFSYPYWGFPYWGYPFVGYPFGVWYPWVGLTWQPTVVYEPADGHLPGTLVVDVWDARTGQLIWRGWAEGALLSAPEPEDLPEFIDEAIGKIMETFPPGD